ncbi:MAG: helix-turn-helix transcriptional regulator [Vagococcus sp.]|jgi:transcriptional regulator with XRE-family HTH domain|nr:helix-turn-helix transcriptional regulator [Vagococcus sp.]
MGSSILNNIKEIRKELGLSQFQLAELSGLSPSSINDIENGKHIPSQISMMLISKALDLKVEIVFNLDYKGLII